MVGFIFKIMAIVSTIIHRTDYTMYIDYIFNDLIMDKNPKAPDRKLCIIIIAVVGSVSPLPVACVLHRKHKLIVTLTSSVTLANAVCRMQQNRSFQQLKEWQHRSKPDLMHEMPTRTDLEFKTVSLLKKALAWVAAAFSVASEGGDNPVEVSAIKTVLINIRVYLMYI